VFGHSAVSGVAEPTCDLSLALCPGEATCRLGRESSLEVAGVGG